MKMAVTADEYELPLIIGSAEEVATLWRRYKVYGAIIYHTKMLWQTKRL